MTPELRARLLEYVPASVLDAHDAYEADLPLDERTPGFVRLRRRINAWVELDADRDRLISDVTD